VVVDVIPLGADDACTDDRRSVRFLPIQFGFLGRFVNGDIDFQTAVTRQGRADAAVSRENPPLHNVPHATLV
jgi:hypothetical protein